jgi:hypothetical protein
MISFSHNSLECNVSQVAENRETIKGIKGLDAARWSPVATQILNIEAERGGGDFTYIQGDSRAN